MQIFHRLVNRFLKRFEVCRVATTEKVVYLTFDDGPEPAITEFVLEQLAKYGYKATFFSRGDNAEKHPQLLQRLRDEGHALGNHTYSHIHSFKLSGKAYADDVMRCNPVLQTSLLRPPYGCLKLSAWLRLRKDYTIFYWSLNSGDSDMGHYNYENSMRTLKTLTSPGEVVLFHFCHKHEKETRELLPEYLEWLHQQGFVSDKMPAEFDRYVAQ